MDEGSFKAQTAEKMRRVFRTEECRWAKARTRTQAAYRARVCLRKTGEGRRGAMPPIVAMREPFKGY